MSTSFELGTLRWMMLLSFARANMILLGLITLIFSMIIEIYNRGFVNVALVLVYVALPWSIAVNLFELGFAFMGHNTPKRYILFGDLVGLILSLGGFFTRFFLYLPVYEKNVTRVDKASAWLLIFLACAHFLMLIIHSVHACVVQGQKKLVEREVEKVMNTDNNVSTNAQRGV